jgi:Kef-type K+ transport system membrane component KefB
MVLLWDIGTIILVATVSAFIARLLKQPLILAYVVTGILIGPWGLKLITQESIIRTLADLGIAFLLFMVGLELNLDRLKSVGKVSVGCGMGQIVITFIFGFILATLLGYGNIEAFYIGFAITISSTMIVIKLLSDKEELDTLHGKIILGTLLMQDIVTIMVLAIMTTFDSFSLMSILTAAVTALGLMAVAILSGKYILPPLIWFASKSVELLFLTALAWFFAFSAFSHIAFETLLGFAGSAISIGSFLAGVSLASFPQNLEIVSRIRSLKDFFVTIFFVSLGMQVKLQLPVMQNMMVISIFVLIVTPFIIMLLCSFFGYGKRTAVLTGLALAQISEFSLVLAAQGISLGHISPDVFSLMTWTMLVTSTISSYYILHDSEIYNKLLPHLKFLDRFSRENVLEDVPANKKSDVILFGCDRMGSTIIKTLQAMKKEFIVVDLNPDIIKSLMGQRIPSVYGDVGDLEIMEKVNLRDADVVISTIPYLNENLLTIEETRKRNPNAIVITTAKNSDNALTLYKGGADYVIIPHMLGGEKASEFIMDYMVDKNEFTYLRKKHIAHLENQNRLDFLMRYEPSFMGLLERKFEHRFDYKT